MRKPSSNAIWTVVLILALVASFAINNSESAKRDAAQRAQLIRGCDRNSEKSILDAAYKQTTSDTRRGSSTHRGDRDWVAADKYQEYALGGAALVPLPSKVVAQMEAGNINVSKALIGSVIESRDSAGDNIFRVSEKARSVLHQGCVEAYS